jgi:Lon protease-like protein
MRLPVFPLGMVLYPGTLAPLHLFEPRYRRLLADIKDAARRFVILPAQRGVADRDLPVGRVGCVAELTEVQPFPDGRANILVLGRERVVLDRFVDDPAPYHVGEFAELPDAPGDSRIALAVTADGVVQHFRRVARAVHTIEGRDEPLPDLPEEPALLAWRVGAMLDFDDAARYALLAERSPARRLAMVDAVLRKALPDLELRAAMGPAARDDDADDDPGDDDEGDEG